MFNSTAATSEIIGLLLPDSDPSLNQVPPNGRPLPQARALVRKADGQMALEVVAADSTISRDAMKTGCFRRGSPIIDPVSREIMGYEMEIVESP
jgi:hypothetical protein